MTKASLGIRKYLISKKALQTPESIPSAIKYYLLFP
jgi:hypothetical protein